ncbi:E3 ubiquitin-protein ligase At1g63170 [Benincasa hispida]|uniref:E3 ubiquitin-protein ligase At1g63170 n=1 Tax=Benincasa hispida TaxID=102211 RepID=UPI0018FFB2A8|nr:E3 ubiquitin-protein ligase At1g63170 [Benincasa hispida]XP_038901172.1 E3 ubiquitin-protein ligase At1g63170 [Benincasa hispida]
MRDSLPHSSTPFRAVDNSPLLGHSVTDGLFRSRGFIRRSPQPLRGAVRLLRRASGRQMMLREPSVRVRETAAEQLEERQSDWAYSKPIILLDLLWNLAFVVISFTVLGLSTSENPSVPLRFWISGYALQCIIHMSCVAVEYKRRRSTREPVGLDRSGGWTSGEDSNSVSGSDGDDYATEVTVNEEESSNLVKHIESANTMFSFIWWLLGFYWVTAGGQELIDSSPQLYWLCITFLAFDVVFVLICVAIACLVGVAICCCLPCIIAILYAVTDQEGATKEEIERLPKYKFNKTGDVEKVNGDIQESTGGIMTACDTGAPLERFLRPEDSECCICLSAYENGAELRELPCNHHFHCNCIDKWLHMNATCPLCKFNILKPNSSSSEEV